MHTRTHTYMHTCMITHHCLGPERCHLRWCLLPWWPPQSTHMMSPHTPVSIRAFPATTVTLWHVWWSIRCHTVERKGCSRHTHIHHGGNGTPTHTYVRTYAHSQIIEDQLNWATTYDASCSKKQLTEVIAMDQVQTGSCVCVCAPQIWQTCVCVCVCVCVRERHLLYIHLY